MRALLRWYPRHQAVVPPRTWGANRPQLAGRHVVRNRHVAASSQVARRVPVSGRPYGEGGPLTRVVRPIAARGTDRLGHLAYARTVTAAARSLRALAVERVPIVERQRVGGEADADTSLGAVVPSENGLSSVSE